MQQFLTKWYRTWHGCSSFMRKILVKISKRLDETALNVYDYREHTGCHTSDVYGQKSWFVCNISQQNTETSFQYKVPVKTLLMYAHSSVQV